VSEEMTVFLTQAWSHSWVQASVVVLASLVVAKLVQFALSRFLRRVTALTESDVDDQLVEQLHRPIFISVVLFGLHVGLQIQEMPLGLRIGLDRLVKTAAILIWTGTGMRVCATVLEGLSRLSQKVAWLEARTLPLFDNLARLVMLGASAYFLMMTWNINVGAWLASAGIVGIAVGFAAKDSIANLFGGLFVIMDAPYKIGDFINLDTGERGRVIKIGLRSTRLMTRDDVEITLPNAVIANAKIVNESGGPSEKTRVTVTIGVAYGSELEAVRATLGQAVRSVPQVVGDPEPRIRFVEMGDSALIFRVMVWIEEPILRGLVIDALNTSIYNGLNEAGITIPFPQRDVHVYRASASGA